VQFDRLRLQGFKSFVDPTEMAIREGLTGVVGPNGCGKSNLLEALRWVMGETRASAVRGEGMEDVIFAGTDSRPARARASVELVLDNAERLAPAAFNAVDRIEISRRIARDIGSAYSVNGRSVRARDVQMLFADASTGAHSPALVRQGQIAELISARPKARRRVLEEAAGISGLYQRRHEAELKLNAAETNLARVDDQIETLEAQARSLGRQAGQARRYREIAQELRRVEATVLWLRWHGAETARAEAECARLAATAATARAESAAGRSARARDAAEAALAPLREEAEVGAALLHRAAIERDRLEGAHAAAAEEIAGTHPRLHVLVNTGDDFEHLGLHVCPDIDTLLYTLSGQSDQARGWGLANETFNALEALGRLGGETWFQLGDRDLATHLWRTRQLAAGKPLSEVTAQLAQRFGVAVGVYPMSDDPVRTTVRSPGGDLPFQQYFVRERCEPPVLGFEFEGIHSAAPNRTCHDLLCRGAVGRIIICPSNPYVSVDPILQLPGLWQSLRDAAAAVILVSPIVGGAALKGPAAKMMAELGAPVTALGVAQHYCTHYPGLVDHFVIDDSDATLAADIEALGIEVAVTGTVMREREDKRRLAEFTLDLGAAG